MKAKGIFHIGMGVSGGEEGARNGECCSRGGRPQLSASILIII